MARLRVCHLKCSHRPATCIFQLPYKGSQCGPQSPQNNGPGDQRRILLWAQGPGEAPASTDSVEAGTKSLRSGIASQAVIWRSWWEETHSNSGPLYLDTYTGLIVKTPLGKCPTSCIYNDV